MNNYNALEESSLESHWIWNLKAIFFIVCVCWVAYFLSYFISISDYGIRPRSFIGLLGVITSPFLHGSLWHLIGNSLGLLVFGCAIAIIEKKMTVTILQIIILGGSATWIFARNANHIGASGLIFGLFGYLLFLGYFQKKPKFIFISIFTLCCYGSMIFGVIPGNPGVSWEGHLFGFLAGVASAKWR